MLLKQVKIPFTNFYFSKWLLDLNVVASIEKSGTTWITRIVQYELPKIACYQFDDAVEAMMFKMSPKDRKKLNDSVRNEIDKMIAVLTHKEYL